MSIKEGQGYCYFCQRPDSEVELTYSSELHNYQCQFCKKEMVSSETALIEAYYTIASRFSDELEIFFVKLMNEWRSINPKNPISQELLLCTTDPHTDNGFDTCIKESILTKFNVNVSQLKESHYCSQFVYISLQDVFLIKAESIPSKKDIDLILFGKIPFRMIIQFFDGSV